MIRSVRSSVASALLLATGVACLAVSGWTFATHGSSEEGLLYFARYTARLAFPLFALAYSASSLARLVPGRATHALLRHRRGVGLAYALAQGVHLLAIGAFIAGTDERLEPDVETVVGGIGMLLAALMAATSTDGAQRRLGRGWGWLHRAGLHTLWLIYAVTYLGNVQADPAYWPGLATVIAIAGLRVVAFASRQDLGRSIHPARPGREAIP